MRVLICGDRHWRDYPLVLQTLAILLKETLAKGEKIECVIEGEAQGADTCGKLAAKDLLIPVLPFKADWSQYGKAAGPIRNRQMLREGKPDLVLAFHSDLANSKGTKDMVMVAREAGVEVRIIQGESHA